MKQQNRVELSFPSIVKIFAIYGLALDVFFILLYAPLTLFSANSTELGQFIGALLLSPFIFILLATLGYPFFALFSKLRGGLLLTVVGRKNNHGD